MVKYIYVDYVTGRCFYGIDDVVGFSITCKTTTITGFGQKVTFDGDERAESQDVSVIQAT